MRLGTAILAGKRIVVAQGADDGSLLNATALLQDVAVLQTLDDLLELADQDLAHCLAEIRLRLDEADLGQSAIKLLSPLVRPARVRDCGIITTHLKPAFEVMIERLKALPELDTAPAVEALEARLSGSQGRKLGWGERNPSTLSATLDAIPNPGGELDFELEMAAIVRRNDKGKPEIFGYTLYNDWTLRDVQVDHFARTLNLHGEAKNFPLSNTIGPMVVMADDLPEPMTESLRVEVDGTVLTEGTLAEADWTFAEAVDEIYATEAPAGTEILGSGTILGGSMFEKGMVLAPGSKVVMSSPAIGVLENIAGVAA